MSFYLRDNKNTTISDDNDNNTRKGLDIKGNKMWPDMISRR